MMPSKGAVALRHSSSLQQDSDVEDAQYDGDNESREPSPTSSKSEKISDKKNKDASDDESNANKTSEADGEEFEVDEVLGMSIDMKLQCPIRFKVKWVGFKEEDDTWEDMSDLNCQTKIDQYIQESGQETKYKRAMQKYKKMQSFNSETKSTRSHLRRSAHDSHLDSDGEESEKEFKCKKTRTRKIQKPDVFDVRVADLVQKSSVVKNRNSTYKKPVIGMIVDHEDISGGKKQYRVRYRGLHSSEDNWFRQNALEAELVEEYWSKVLPLGDVKEEDKEYEVESIVDSREEQGEVYYKVRWRGFRAKDDTWLPRKDMNCPKIIERFENILASLSEREEWVVEKIVGERGEGDEKEYLVRWQGFDAKGDTWEPGSNLLGCQDKLKQWAKQNEGEDSGSEKEDSVVSSRPLKKRVFDETEDAAPKKQGSTRKTKRTPYRKHAKLDEEAVSNEVQEDKEVEEDQEVRSRGRKHAKLDEEAVSNEVQEDKEVEEDQEVAEEQEVVEEQEEVVEKKKSNVGSKRRSRGRKEEPKEAPKEGGITRQKRVRRSNASQVYYGASDEE